MLREHSQAAQSIPAEPPAAPLLSWEDSPSLTLSAYVVSSCVFALRRAGAWSVLEEGAPSSPDWRIARMHLLGALLKWREIGLQRCVRHM